MSKDDIYNKLCAVFFMEEERLRQNVEDLERLLPLSGYSSSLMVDYIRAKAIQSYFNSYMLEVLKYLAHFDR